MADREKYMIKVEGNLVEVTPEVYYAYFRMERQERGQEEKKAYIIISHRGRVRLHTIPQTILRWTSNINRGKIES